MIIRYLYNSFLYLVIGNIRGLVLQLFGKQESPLWVSRYHFEYLNSSKGRAGFILWIFVTISISSFFLIAFPSGGIMVFVPSMFFVVGIMLLVSSISNLEKMYIYPDTLEIRVGFQTTFRLLTKDILYVLRDKESGPYAHIIYSDRLAGIDDIGGSNEGRYRIKIPVSLFQKGELSIGISKLHPNLF